MPVRFSCVLRRMGQQTYPPPDGSAGIFSAGCISRCVLRRMHQRSVLRRMYQRPALRDRKKPPARQISTAAPATIAEPASPDTVVPAALSLSGNA